MSTPMPETGNNPQKDTTTAVATKPGRGGLEGMAVGTTTLSKVDEKAGQLLYRGHNIHDLVDTTTFEEVAHLLWLGVAQDRKSTRLNSSHVRISYAVFCLKKKKIKYYMLNIYILY